MANYVKFMRGSLAAYNKLVEKDQDTLYFLSDTEHKDGLLYLGTKLISSSCTNTDGGATSLDDLTDVLITTTGLNYESLLMFNPNSNCWENHSFEDLRFTKATQSLAGLGGLVPAPQAGEQNYFLRGDGTWAEVNCSTQVFEIIARQGETHSEALNRVLSDVIVNNGDITIVKDKIINDNYQYTSYVYNGSNWVATDGNYSVENVYFKDDLILTESIGTLVIPEEGRIVVPAAGKNIKQVFETIFAHEKEPIIEMPSINLNTNGGVYEVGTIVLPQYEFTFNAGKYEYGPATDVEIIKSTVSTTDTTELELEDSQGEFRELLIEDDTNYSIIASIEHSIGTMPVTNLNHIYSEGQIQQNTISVASTPFTGYRAYFYGIDNSDDTIDSAFIRNKLINGGAYDQQKKIIFNASTIENAKRFIIAIPENTIRSGLVYAEIISSMHADITKEYVELATRVDVEGANNYEAVKYRVWVYQPASIASTEVHMAILS